MLHNRRDSSSGLKATFAKKMRRTMSCPEESRVRCYSRNGRTATPEPEEPVRTRGRGNTRATRLKSFAKNFFGSTNFDRAQAPGTPGAPTTPGAVSDDLDVAENSVQEAEAAPNKKKTLSFKNKVQAAVQVAVQYGAKRAAGFTLGLMSGSLLQPAETEGPNELRQLVQRLSSQRASSREEAACILAVYTDLQPTCRQKVVDEGALEKIFPLLKSRSMASRSAGADVLGQLARDPAIRKEILATNAVPRLTKLLKRRYSVKVRTSCAKALTSLAVGKEHTDKLLSSGPVVRTVLRELNKVAEEVSPVPGRNARDRRNCGLLAALLELLARLAQRESVREEIAANDELFALLCSKLYSLDNAVLTSAMELTVQLVKVEKLRILFLEQGMVSRLSQIWQESSGKAQVQALRVLSELATSPTTHESIQKSIKKRRSHLSRGKVQALFGSFESDEDSIGVFNLASCLPMNQGTATYLHKSGVGKMVLGYLEMRIPKLAAPVCRLVGSLASGEAIRQEMEEGGVIRHLSEYIFWDDLEVVESAMMAMTKFAGSDVCVADLNNPRVLGRLLELQEMEDQDMIYASLELLRCLAKSEAIKETLRGLDLHIR